MRDRCHGCETFDEEKDVFSHCNGSGTVRVMEQDGVQTYVCQCSCAVFARRRRDADREIAAFIKKYGKDRIREALA